MKLNGVIPWGRSFEEYRLIFALTEADLAGNILGCGDGPASFNAEATAIGHRVVSCDPVYVLGRNAIGEKVRGCGDEVIAQLRRDVAEFNWDYFSGPEHLAECRLAALRLFLADFDKGMKEGRYVVGALPTLPFADDQFSLALVSHVLFLYSEQFGREFHVAAVAELIRVAREVRIFPLLGLDRRWSPHFGPVREHLERAGFEVEIIRANYEFMRAEGHAGNRMMRIRRGQTAGQPVETQEDVGGSVDGREDDSSGA